MLWRDNGLVVAIAKVPLYASIFLSCGPGELVITYWMTDMTTYNPCLMNDSAFHFSAFKNLNASAETSEINDNYLSFSEVGWLKDVLRDVMINSMHIGLTTPVEVSTFSRIRMQLMPITRWSLPLVRGCFIMRTLQADLM